MSVPVAAAALLGVWARAGGASPAAPPASLVLPAGQALHLGESLPVTVVNDSASSIYHFDCSCSRAWMRGVGGRWFVATQSTSLARPWAARSRIPTLAARRNSRSTAIYAQASTGSPCTPARTQALEGAQGPDPPRPYRARLQFTVGPAPVPPKPQLPEKRILRLAMTAAKHGGDPRPNVIQHAAGTRFNAVLIGQGDLVFDWNWSYLIAARVHFSYGGLGPPGSSSTIHGTVAVRTSRHAAEAKWLRGAQTGKP